MFETLAKILELDSVHSQGDALHGLGHLHHPLTEQLISKYIAKHPDISPKMRKYAFAASKFQVL